MNIKSATIIRDHYGPDNCFLYTDLPGSEWPFNESLTFSFKAARGTGPEYVRRYFDLEPKLIEV